jgi:hypothetical protein
MANLQITDFNLSDIEFCDELMNEELLEINGGGLWRWLKKVFGFGNVGISVNVSIPLKSDSYDSNFSESSYGYDSGSDYYSSYSTSSYWEQP